MVTVIPPLPARYVYAVYIRMHGHLSKVLCPNVSIRGLLDAES